MTEFTVVDTDAHYLEDLAELAEYMDEPWRTRLRHRDTPHDTDSTAHRHGKFQPSVSGDRYMSGRIRRDEVSYPSEAMTPEEFPSVMRHVGIDKAIIVSNQMLGYGRIKSPDRIIALADGYIDYMLDRVVDPDAGIYTLIHAPYHEPDAAVELIDRVGDEDGIVGLCFITPEATPVLGDKRYDVIYEAAEAADLPIVLHGGSLGVDNRHFDGFTRLMESHTVGFLTNNVVHLTSMLTQGVPEKFPDLDLVFLECGLFWVPMMMYRMDAEYLKRQSEAPLLRQKPSEYMKEFYYGTQPIENPDEEVYLEQIIEMMGGPERLMYASDYPHWDYDRPSSITELSFLSASEKAAVLGDNAEAVFGL